jgi:tetratricopeptide (TPR) repeat protein
MEVSQIYYLRGEYQKAEKVLRGALVMSPENPDLYACLGATCQAQGKNEEAVKYYQQAIKSCPSEQCSHSNLGEMLLIEGKIDEAIEEFTKALDLLDPSDPVAERASALLQIAKVTQETDA